MISRKWQTALITEKTMPLILDTFGRDSLSADDFQTMKCWIEQGYPQN